MARNHRLLSAAITTAAALSAALVPSAIAGSASSPPELSLVTSTQSGSISATAIVLSTSGSKGTLTWKLVGPVARPSSGACDRARYTGAATVTSGTLSMTANTKANIPARSVGTTKGCFSYIASLSGISANTIAAGESDAVASTYATTLSTMFLPAGWINGWTVGSSTQSGSATWELTQLKNAGINRVILQNATGVVGGTSGANDTIYTAYPAPATAISSPGYGSPSWGAATVVRGTAYQASLQQTFATTDEVGTLLSAGDATGSQVVIGLSDDHGLFTQPQTAIQTTCVISPSCQPTAWLSNEVSYAEQSALEVWAEASTHTSFAGWYLPLELSSSAWTSPAAVSDFNYLDGSISNFLHQLTPNATITVSPFVTATSTSSSLPATPNCPWNSSLTEGATVTSAFNTPCGFMGQMRSLLENSSITEVLLQDGLGDNATSPYISMTPAMLPSWVNAVGEAAAAATTARGVAVSDGIDADLYSTAGTALTGSQIVSDLRIPNNSTSDLAGFSLSEMDPEWTSTATVWASYLAATGL